jgi:AAA ATPase containing von Willebrand factor type A (vWA) domain
VLSDDCQSTGPPPTKKSFTNQEDQGDAATEADQDKVQTEQEQEQAATEAKDVKDEISQHDLSKANGGDHQDSSVKEEGASTLNGEKQEGHVKSEQQEEAGAGAGAVTDAKDVKEETPKDNVANSGDDDGTNTLNVKKEQVENKETEVPSSSSGQAEATLEVPPPATAEESTTAQPVVLDEPSTANNVPTLPPGVPMGVPMALPINNVSVDTTPTPLDNPNPSFTPAAISRPNGNVPPARLAMQTNTSNPTTTTTTSTVTTDANILTEKENIPVQYVGRIIGKGGEQIRDLQARSACKVDVDQNVPHGAPRVITYQGTRDKIDFAKSLVAMLCKDNWKTVELPLGFASRAQLQVPSGVIGKIIGRGGEMIKVS